MTAIEYISSKLPLIEGYFKLKNISPIVYHTQLKRMECGTKLFILKKEQVESIEEALIVTILVDEMNFGNYHFTSKDENIVLDLNIKLLANRYNGNIEINTAKNLMQLFIEYGEPADVVCKNYEWPMQIPIKIIKDEKCFEEKVLKSFKLVDQWNDIEYFFETENYYVRLLWQTAA